MNKILSVTHDNLTKTQSDMVRQTNHWCCIKNFTVENEIIINIWNLVSNWPTKALNDKRCEPFRILQQFHFFYKLNISSEWYVTDIFHISNLTKTVDSKWSSLTEQKNLLLKSVVINDENQTEWALEEILNSQYSKSNHHLQYKVCWTDCNPDSIWYNINDKEFQNALKVLQKYHTQYFNKLNLQFIELKLIYHQSTKTDWREIQNTVSEIVSNSLLLPYWI